MNKETIYEEFFNAVTESLEWGLESDRKEYSSYIDGLCSMAYRLVNNLDENKSENSK